ncbi:MAG: 4Fe-4S dicluster domain-containing protein [Leptospira sp.]|nr:4Fe-4S dicluster domain-containing protein [Leptospira sp.]
MVFPKLSRGFTRKFHKTENKRERTIQGNFLIPVPTGHQIPDQFPRRVSLGEVLVTTPNLRILAPVNGIVSLNEEKTHFQIKQDGAWNTNSPYDPKSLTLDTFINECKMGALASLDFPNLTLDQYFSSFQPMETFEIFIAPYTRNNFLPFSEILHDEMRPALREFITLLQQLFPKATMFNYLENHQSKFKHPQGIPEYFISQKTNQNIPSIREALSSRKVMYLGPETIYHILRMIYFKEPFTRRHLYVCLVDKKGRIDTESRYYLLTNGQCLDFLVKHLQGRYKVASFQSMFESVTIEDINSLGFFNIYEHQVLVLYERKPVKRKAFACIDCLECNTYCPTNANPISIVKNRHSQFNVSNCIECGICTLYCPSGIDLRSMIQVEKEKHK